MTVLDLLKRFSPKMCRLVARKARGWRGMSHADIAKITGISVSRVADISKMDKWDNITVGNAIKFALACGVNHLSLRRQMQYAKRDKMTHISRGNSQQRRFYARLFKAGQKSMLRASDE